MAQNRANRFGVLDERGLVLLRAATQNIWNRQENGSGKVQQRGKMGICTEAIIGYICRNLSNGALWKVELGICNLNTALRQTKLALNTLPSLDSRYLAWCAIFSNGFLCYRYMGYAHCCVRVDISGYDGGSPRCVGGGRQRTAVAAALVPEKPPPQ